METAEKQKNIVGKCPECGADVAENANNYSCTAYPECRFALWRDNLRRQGHQDVTVEEATALLTSQEIRLEGLTSKAGRTFSCNGILERREETGRYGIKFIFDEKEGGK